MSDNTELIETVVNVIPSAYARRTDIAVNGSDEQFAEEVMDNRNLSKEEKTELFSLRVTTGYVRFRSHPVGDAFMTFLEFGMMGAGSYTSRLPTNYGFNRYRSNFTILGSDAATLSNASRMVPEKEFHQLLVHGHYDKFIIDGVITTPKSVAEIMLKNGFKYGTPVRCISCHTGRFADGAAYQLSIYLKSPVLAPTDKVTILDRGQYLIFKDGFWKQF